MESSIQIPEFTDDEIRVTESVYNRVRVRVDEALAMARRILANSRFGALGCHLEPDGSITIDIEITPEKTMERIEHLMTATRSGIPLEHITKIE